MFTIYQLVIRISLAHPQHGTLIFQFLVDLIFRVVSCRLGRGSNFGRISKAMLGFTETFEFFLEGATGGVAITLW